MEGAIRRTFCGEYYGTPLFVRLYSPHIMRQMRYIHERAEWPSFEWDAASITPVVARVRHVQGRLLGRMEGLGFDLRQEASLATLTSDVVKSSAIEGEYLDRDEVRSSIAQRLGLPVAGMSPPRREVDAVVAMMLDATQRCSEPLTAERLCGWQAALFPTAHSGFKRIVVGAWRTPETGPMQVVSGQMGREKVHFEAPAAERVPLEMERFLKWFEGPVIDPVLHAAVAHFWFVTVHPFEDGNGRIARAIADMALARADGTSQRFYSMSAQIEREKSGYYAALEAQQKGDLDLTPWLSWFLGCLQRSIDAAESALGGVLRKAKVWATIGTAPVSDRQRLVLNRLLDGFEGKLTTGKYAKLAKCSTDTALRDVQDLVERGILEQNDAGGRSTSYSIAAGMYSDGPAEPFPVFELFEDPLREEAFEKSVEPCGCCGKSRGWLTVRRFDIEENEEIGLCPWCIAEGRAEERGVWLNDVQMINGARPDEPAWREFSDEDWELIGRRTPPLSRWQELNWRMCCGRACRYLGQAMRGDVEPGGKWHGAWASLEETIAADPERAKEQMREGWREGVFPVYVFQCRSCGALLGDWENGM